MRLTKWLEKAAKKLEKANCKTPRLDAEVLLMHALGEKREFIYTYPETKLIPSQQKKLNKTLERRLKHEPIAYIISRKDFFGLPFYINRAVLIPRPETETLMEEALNLIKKEKPKTIYEVGTGSGAVAIALAKNFPKTKIIASDISKTALKTAQKNIVSYHLSRRLKLVHSHLGQHIKFADLLIANLPYLPQKLRSSVEPELLFEPPSALFGGKDGLELYRELLSQTKFRTAIIELGTSQQKKLLEEFIKKKLPFCQTTFKKDLGGNIRVAILHQK